MSANGNNIRQAQKYAPVYAIGAYMAHKTCAQALSPCMELPAMKRK
jgi:hypothetical protein